MEAKDITVTDIAKGIARLNWSSSVPTDSSCPCESCSRLRNRIYELLKNAHFVHRVPEQD